MNKANAVKEIIENAGGRISGKTRLQKTTYFLESRGAGYGFEFDYHYYGPYSEDLTVATLDAAALALIEIVAEPATLGSSYSVFVAREPQSDRTNATSRLREILGKLAKYDTTSLELAATVDFLTKNGCASDPWEETRRRKPLKASEERLNSARRLLAELAGKQA
jgi:uncharacterized protein YwgA